MTVAAQVDGKEAARFLRLLDAEADTWLFRGIHGNGSTREVRGSLETCGDQLAGLNVDGYNVFCVVNESVGFADADVTGIRAMFADFDGAPLPESFELEPHVIVQTSPGRWHAYWLADGVPVDQFKRMQQAIVAKYGTDRMAVNPARLMRVPGFQNWKYSEPFQARIIHESGGVPYNAARIVSAFPQSTKPADTTSQLSGPANSPRVVDHDRHADLLGIAARFARSVHFDGMAEQSALTALSEEATRGRWTRQLDQGELERAFNGALAKLRSGEWGAAQGIAADPGDLIKVDLDSRAPRRQREYVLDPIIPRRVVTLLGGHGGAGKTMLGMQLAVHFAAGQAFAGFAPGPGGRAVFLSFEDEGDDVLPRLDAIIAAFNLPIEAVRANLEIYDGTQTEATIAEEVTGGGLRFTAMLDKVRAAIVGSRLVVIDNASDTFGGNENNRRQVKTFIRKLARLARETDSAILLLAHIDKHAAKFGADNNSYSGSTAWHNGARSRLALLVNGAAIELRHEKSNFSDLALPISLTRGAGGVLLPLDAAQAAQAEKMVAGIATAADAEHVFAALQAAIAGGYSVPTRTDGSATAWHTLSNYPGALGRALAARAGKVRTHAALALLQSEGRIAREDYLTGQYKPRQRWVIVK